jgi:hypothetical protein
MLRFSARSDEAWRARTIVVQIAEARGITRRDGVIHG